jgi:hypothetical protein
MLPALATHLAKYLWGSGAGQGLQSFFISRGSRLKSHTHLSKYEYHIFNLNVIFQNVKKTLFSDYKSICVFKKKDQLIIEK